MMLKGCTVKRRNETVRQCGVTIDGSTRLVTSGDVVDRKTLNALVAAGIVDKPAPIPPSEETPSPNDAAAPNDDELFLTKGSAEE